MWKLGNVWAEIIAQMLACFIWHHPPVGVDSVDKSGSGIRRSSSPVSQGSSSTTTATTATRATSLTATSRIPRPFTVPRISCARCGMRSTISKVADQRGFDHVLKDEKIFLGCARNVRERHHSFTEHESRVLFNLISDVCVIWMMSCSSLMFMCSMMRLQ